MHITQKSKNKKFSIIRSIYEINQYISTLPGNDDVYKFVSMGGFSSISFIKYISDRTVIKNLYVSTLRVGKKELQILDAISNSGRLHKVNFIVGSIMKTPGDYVKKWSYYENFEMICDKNNWKYKTENNHSKILLFDTEAGYFVIETSSNLNENPKIEQFSFEKSEELFNFYKQIFETL